ncbi:MAG TPA: hypothetical protein VE684_02655 [Crenalkalicoccus sp.]|jgi:hypothetical protein|nr:hypothetical protein [Crenalkalicoccus sp.]
MRRAALAALLLSGCAIPPPPPSPDPIQGGFVQEGVAQVPDPAWTAFCVSQATPLSLVALPPDGAAVRPAPTVPPPDYALILRPTPQGSDWRLIVAGEGAPAEAEARALGEALADCATRLGHL